MVAYKTICDGWQGTHKRHANVIHVVFLETKLLERRDRDRERERERERETQKLIPAFSLTLSIYT